MQDKENKENKEYVMMFWEVTGSPNNASQWVHFGHRKAFKPTLECSRKDSKYFRKTSKHFRKTSEHPKMVSGAMEWHSYNDITVLKNARQNNRAEIRKAKTFTKLFPQAFGLFCNLVETEKVADELDEVNERE